MIVGDHDVLTAPQQFSAGVAPDEARTSGYQYGHEYPPG